MQGLSGEQGGKQGGKQGGNKFWRVRNGKENFGSSFLLELAWPSPSFLLYLLGDTITQESFLTVRSQGNPKDDLMTPPGLQTLILRNLRTNERNMIAKVHAKLFTSSPMPPNASFSDVLPRSTLKFESRNCLPSP